MRYRVKKVILIMVSVLVVPFTLNAFEYSENKVEEGYSLLVGKPFKVKYSGQIPESDQVVIGARYIAYFKDYKIVYGTLSQKHTLKIELQASDDLTIGYYEEIFIIVKDSSEKVLQGVMWGVPMYNVCIPGDDVSNFGMDSEFGKLIPKNGKRCIPLYKHGK